MAKVTIKKTRNRRKEHVALLIVLVLMVGALILWILQIKSLFSKESFEMYKEQSQEMNTSIQAGLEFQRSLEDKIPLMDKNPGNMVEELQEIDQEFQKKDTLDKVAEELIHKIQAQEETAHSLPDSPLKNVEEITIE